MFAKLRYEKGIPPGYSDVKQKGIPEAYGDYIGWQQVIEISKKEGRHAVLVVDDLKEDWWQIERSHTIGPRPELLAEFAQATQQRMYMYNSESFLRAAKIFVAANIRDDVIEEVRLRLADQRLSRRTAADLKPLSASAQMADIPPTSDDKPTSSEEVPANSTVGDMDKPGVAQVKRGNRGEHGS